MAICNLKDEDIKKISEGKDNLKSLMSGDLSSLDGMEKAQAKMKEGFDLLSGKSAGPVTLCQCKGYDESLLDQDDDFNTIYPTTETECTNAGGFWQCKEVENFNLQEELLKVNEATTGETLSEKIADIKAKFGEAVDDLDEQIAKVSPALGDFVKNFKMPDLTKKSGCDIFGDGNVDYDVTEAECAQWGGTWVTKDIDFAADIEGGVAAVNSFLSDAAGGITDGISNVIGGVANTVSGALGSDSLKFPDFGGGIPSFPKPGEMVETCVCVGGDATAGTQEECEASGGTWKCKVKPAPDIGSFFSGGLPKISPDTLCNALDDIEVKNQLVTDPTTGKQTIQKVKDILPAKPVVPKEESKAAEPAPTSDTASKQAFDMAEVAILYSQRQALKQVDKFLIAMDLVKDKEVTNAFGWCLRNAYYQKCGRDLDTDSNYFIFGTAAKTKEEDAEVGYAKYVAAAKLKTEKGTNHKTLQARTDQFWKVLVANYNQQSYVEAPYLAEAGLIKWCKEKFEQGDEKLIAPQKKQEALKAAVEVKAPVTTDAQITKDVDALPPEVRGLQTTTVREVQEKIVTTSGGVPKTRKRRINIVWNADEVTRTSRGTYKVKANDVTFRAVNQEDYDAKLRVSKSRKTEIITRPSAFKGTVVQAVYFKADTNQVRTFIIDKAGLSPKSEAIWVKRMESDTYQKKYKELGITRNDFGDYIV